MIQTFGEFIDQMPHTEEYLTISFSPSSNARNLRWSNYGLSADFLGDYFATFFPGSPEQKPELDKQDVVKSSVSYIANELLENAIQHSDLNSEIPIHISLYLYNTRLVFVVSNAATTLKVEKYKEFIHQLLSSDVNELYTTQLEKTAMGRGGSHMGLLTMMNDYSARFGWKFEPLAAHQEAVNVTVMAQLDV
ncbi:MAG TPA: ATP-binding protein [Leptolyngbyaceae cyanobacterium M33_DOE_097]|uniref:ATP-binding protein n=1 Tax=Oscillatoriales cyanobacterium SpSt-418 TaxID=2282169 RepID=A0A7C3KD38_9CYAN|nr:ATP-binding protein [Leptolyngbyaceae cyanobacterium M33_DOE_097]